MSQAWEGSNNFWRLRTNKQLHGWNFVISLHFVAQRMPSKIVSSKLRNVSLLWLTVMFLSWLLSSQQLLFFRRYVARRSKSQCSSGSGISGVCFLWSQVGPGAAGISGVSSYACKCKWPVYQGWVMRGYSTSHLHPADASLVVPSGPMKPDRIQPGGQSLGDEVRYLW